jgi:hypothetical protein
MCASPCVSYSFIEPIHEVSRLRIGRSQFLKLPLVERRTSTMSFSDHETQRDASTVIVVCHFLFVSSVYIYTHTQKLLRPHVFYQLNGGVRPGGYLCVSF